MRLSVIYADKTIVVDGAGCKDPDLVKGDDNHRSIQWDDETGMGVIEVAVGEPLRFTDRRIIQPFLNRFEALNAS